MNFKITCMVATTDRENLDFFWKMNLKNPTVVANQASTNSFVIGQDVLMVTTSTRGVGLNRNIGISFTDSDYVFITDDDMFFYDGLEDKLQQAIQQHPDAGAIIFGFDYFENNMFVRKRMKKSEQIHLFNCLNYGACCTLVKKSEIKKSNITFSELFGGGCLYGSGEDSLFFLECIRKGVRVYAVNLSVGKNEYRESSWFKGYNDKFFFDKGAWIACAFPKLKNIIKWYFILRYRSLSKKSLQSISKRVNDGIKAFEKLLTFDKFYNS